MRDRRHAAPVAIAMPGAGQAGVAMVAPTIARAAPDYYPGVVANTLLGGGYSSRLNQELRIKRGLTYGVGSRLDARRERRRVEHLAQTKNESAPELVAVVLDEIRRVAAAPRRADELEARKLSMIGSVSRRFETTEDLAATLASLEANGIAGRRAHAHDRQHRGRDAAAGRRVRAGALAAASLAIVVAGDAREVRRCAARGVSRTCA